MNPLDWVVPKAASAVSVSGTTREDLKNASCFLVTCTSQNSTQIAQNNLHSRRSSASLGFNMARSVPWHYWDTPETGRGRYLLKVGVRE